MTNTELSWAMLLNSNRAFAALKDRPAYWFPLLAVAAANVVFCLVYYSVVDFSWLSDHLLSAQPQAAEMSEAARAEAAQALSKSVLLTTTLVSVLIGVPVLKLLESACFLLVGRALSLGLTIRQWMALVCWSAWPFLLLALTMFVPLALHSSGQVGPEEANILSLNELFFHVQRTSPWYTLLSTLTVLHPWAWWLTVQGVRSWTGRSTMFAAVFGLFPTAVLYGVWVLVILLGF